MFCGQSEPALPSTVIEIQAPQQTAPARLPRSSQPAAPKTLGHATGANIGALQENLGCAFNLPKQLRLCVPRQAVQQHSPKQQMMKLQLALLVALSFVALGAVAEEEQVERVLWGCPTGTACSYNCEDHCDIACAKLNVPFKSNAQCSRVSARRQLAVAQTYRTCSNPAPGARALLGEDADDRDLAGAQNDTGLCCYCHRAPTPAPTRKPTQKPTTRKPTPKPTSKPTAPYQQAHRTPYQQAHCTPYQQAHRPPYQQPH
eukprot:TRINITY_DN7370_c0_g2_i1.p1 TRINITY_DN7370_c0_g2~~TRINITY_DN7370_c0_g2_i1.p1  ORF type:complete len:259 (+),score=49.27 TRINITY_DN7370_c0_g2_i1:357-1133(+)